ncbi:reticulon-like protein B12 [Euphorbia lathyris]|uniref:reticulon-like protein B12 n=1 Tax=Euphorbia lathyris TaxID=212925 RepID=UPI00331326BA
MGTSDRLFNRQRSLHEIFGGGFIADVILWRQKNVTSGILTVTVAFWIVFERSGYTLLSLVSSVLLLLLAILFFWAKSAAILNRAPPPLPQLHLSEEMVNEIAELIRNRVNAFLSVSQDIALGKDSKLFVEVAGYLLLLSIVGGLTDIVTLTYSSVVIILTVPAVYERYENLIDECVKMVWKKSEQLYVKIDVECIGRIRKWSAALEKHKLS